MLELLSLLFGGVLRLAPEVLKLFNAKADKAHELKMTELQLQIDQARATQQIDLAHAQGLIAADTAEMSAFVEALKGQSVSSGVQWIDAVSQSVRPFLTYWWCVILYTAYKFVAIYLSVHAGEPLSLLATVLVSDFDRAVIGSMFSFWFVDRSLRKGKLS